MINRSIHRFTRILTTLLVLAGMLSPAHAESAFELGQRFCEIHFGDEARECLRRAAKEEPKNSEIHIDIARIIKEGYGPYMRAIKEYRVYLSDSPNGPYADEARNAIAGWDASVAKYGDRFFSNRDCWFRDYYGIHDYHSWDKDPQPDWTYRADEKRAGLPMFDVHFQGRSFQHPGGGDKFTVGPWTGPFLRQFLERWGKTDVNGAAEVYLMVTKDGKVDHVITRLDGGKQFQEQVLSVMHSFDGSPFLADAARTQCVFRAELGRKPARALEGNWSAFTYDGPPVLYSAKLTGVIGANRDPHQNVAGFVEHVEPVQLGAHPEKLKTDSVPAKARDAKEVEKTLASAQKLIDQLKEDEAADLLWPLCEENNAKACYMLGHVYNNGTAKTAPWHRLAAPFMKVAADSGIAEAQYEYGRMCDCVNGALGWRPDAINYYQKGAAQGNVNCCLSLAIFYEFGDGVPKNLDKAAELYKKAADRGDADAIEGLKRVKGSSKS